MINKENININNSNKNNNIKKAGSMISLKHPQYQILIKRDFKTDRRNAIQRKIGLNIEIPDEIDIINSLLKKPQERNLEDINKIAFFISGSYLINGLLDTAQKKQKDIEKLVYEISFRIKYKFISENKILFRIGDIPDNFYIIIQGKVEILKTKKIIKIINGFDISKF